MKYMTRLLLSAVMIGALAIAAGCSDTKIVQEASKHSTEAQSTQQETSASKDVMVKLVVYVPREDGRGVSPQTITVDKQKKTVKDAINLMIETDGSQSYPVFANGTKAMSVSVDKGIATVDMSKQFLTQAEGLTARLRLAAVVNTVLAFDEVKAVRFHVEDKALSTYGGLDLSSPVGPMKDSIVK